MRRRLQDNAQHRKAESDQMREQGLMQKLQGMESKVAELEKQVKSRDGGRGGGRGRGRDREMGVASICICACVRSNFRSFPQVKSKDEALLQVPILATFPGRALARGPARACVRVRACVRAFACVRVCVRAFVRVYMCVHV